LRGDWLKANGPTDDSTPKKSKKGSRGKSADSDEESGDEKEKESDDGEEEEGKERDDVEVGANDEDDLADQAAKKRERRKSLQFDADAEAEREESAVSCWNPISLVSLVEMPACKLSTVHPLRLRQLFLPNALVRPHMHRRRMFMIRSWRWSLPASRWCASWVRWNIYQFQWWIGHCCCF
jgi:hypothetical protein